MYVACPIYRFQELDLSKEALLFADSAREVEWRLACEEAVKQIDSKTNYKMVTTHTYSSLDSQLRD